MAKVTRFNKEDDIIETIFEGNVVASNIFDVMRYNAELAVRYNCLNWLNDFRKAKIEISNLDTIKFPAVMQELQNILGANIYRIKRAIIKNQEDTDFEFAEIVNENRGQNDRVFSNPYDARKWLKG